MTTRATLNGFDMISSLTQQTINAQFKNLWLINIIPNSWQISQKDPNYFEDNPEASQILNQALEGNPTTTWNGLTTEQQDAFANALPALSAFIAPPVVTLLDPSQTGGYSRSKMTLTFQENSQYLYIKTEGLHASIEMVPLEGWSVSFETDLSMVNITDPNALNIPEEVKTQLAQFPSSIFTINGLFMLFNEITIDDTFTVIPPPGLDVNTQGTEAYQLENALQTIITSVTKAYNADINTNPFILGYQLRQPAPGATPPAPTYTPTDIRFSVYTTEQNPEVNNLNYLIMTDKNAAPSGNNVPTSNLVTQQEPSGDWNQGAFALAKDLICMSVGSGLAASMKNQSQLKSTLVFSCDNNLNYTAKVNNTDGGTMTVQLLPQLNSARLQAAFKYTYDVKPMTLAPWTDATGYVSWNVYFDFYIGTDNSLRANVSQSEPYAPDPELDGFIGDLTEFLDQFGGLAEFLLECIPGVGVIIGITADLADLVLDELTQTDTPTIPDLVNSTATISEQIILPTGDTYLYTNPFFDAQGHLHMAISIQTEA
ncbi:MAG: hypothetical protein ACO1RX_14345 [Candidatus Sericytochromatia bacterium]